MAEVEPKGWRPKIDASGIRPKLFCGAEFWPSLLNAGGTLFVASLLTGFGPWDFFGALAWLLVTHGLLTRVAAYDPVFFSAVFAPSFPARMPAVSEIGAKLPHGAAFTVCGVQLSKLRRVV